MPLQKQIDSLSADINTILLRVKGNGALAAGYVKRNRRREDHLGHKWAAKVALGKVLHSTGILQSEFNDTYSAAYERRAETPGITRGRSARTRLRRGVFLGRAGSRSQFPATDRQAAVVGAAPRPSSDHPAGHIAPHATQCKHPGHQGARGGGLLPEL